MFMMCVSENGQTSRSMSRFYKVEVAMHSNISFEGNMLKNVWITFLCEDSFMIHLSLFLSVYILYIWHFLVCFPM